MYYTVQANLGPAYDMSCEAYVEHLSAIPQTISVKVLVPEKMCTGGHINVR